jgi:hypothetical protein
MVSASPFHPRWVTALALLAGATLATPALAVPGNYQIVQTGSTNQSYSAFGANNSGAHTFGIPAPVSINPFSSYNTGSGTLNSVTVRWDHTMSFSGTAGSGGGGISAGGGGSAYISSINYGGNGDGGNASGGPNQAVSLTKTWCGSFPCDYTFTAANAGVTFDPNIWTVLSGNSVYTVTSNTQVNGGWTDIVSGLWSLNSLATVTYAYYGEQVPANVPLAPSAALLGLGLAAIGLSRRARQGITSCPSQA